MAVITLPAGLRLSVQWTFEVPQQTNRSAFTGTRKVIGLPGAEKWLAKVTPQEAWREVDARKWRAFIAALRGAENTLYLPALPSKQTEQANPTVTAAVAGNRAVDLSSVAGLEPGMMMTVRQTNGHRRLVTIVGIAGLRVSFEPYLTSNPVTGAAAFAEIQNPYAVMAQTSGSNGWNDTGAEVTFSLDLEEAL